MQDGIGGEGIRAGRIDIRGGSAHINQHEFLPCAVVIANGFD